MSKLVIKISLSKDNQVLGEQSKEIDSAVLEFRNGNFQVETAIADLGQTVTKQAFLKYKT